MALTTESRAQLVALLKAMVPQDITMNVMLAIQSRFVLTAIETVILRESSPGNIEVLLLQRSNSDPVWHGAWHSPGSMVRATDITGDEFLGAEDAFKRVQNSELGVTFTRQPEHVATFVHNTDRGKETAIVFVCEVTGEQKTGKFFDVNNLPSTLLSHHTRIINAAVEYFKRQRK